MGKEAYSLYEAKARLSMLVRKARRRQRIIITYHGKPAAELGPVAPEPESLEERLEQLEEVGAIEKGAELNDTAFEPIARRPGALARFLSERD